MKIFFLAISLLMLPLSYTNGATVNLVKNGKTDYQILLRHNAPVSFIQAAKELQAYFFKVTNIKLAIHSVAQKDQKYIIIGAHPILNGIKEFNSNRYQDEKFLIATTLRKDIVIMGGEETKSAKTIEPGNFGVLYGTYEFIERWLGVRWYTPGEFGECYAAKSDIIVNNLPFRHQSRYFSRTLWPYYFNEGSFGESIRFYRRMRGIGYKQCNPNHSLQGLGLAQNGYTINAPEIFALKKDGSRAFGVWSKSKNNWERYPHLCLSNPKTVEVFMDAIEQWYMKTPKGKTLWNTVGNSISPTENFIYLVPNDNFSVKICQCKQCQAKINHSGSYSSKTSELVFDFIRRVALKVKKRYPNKKVVTLAYEGYQAVPKTVELPDNVIVRLCVNPYIIYWGEEAYRQRIAEKLQAWSKVVKEVSVWQYMMPYNNFPYSLPHIITKFYRHNEGFLTSAFTELMDDNNDKTPFKKNPALKGHIVVRDLPQSHLNIFFTMKSLWGTPFDVDKELEKYYRLFYGPAALPMKQYHETIIKCWEHPASSLIPLPKSVYSVSFSAKNLYEDIYNPAIIVALDKDLTSALALVAKDSIYHKRILWLKTGYFDKFKAKAVTYYKEKGQKIIIISPKHDKMSGVNGIPVIDGYINDRAWNKVPVRSFVKTTGNIPPRFATTFKLMQKNNILYLAIRAVDPDINNLLVKETAHDGAAWADDSIEIFMGQNLDNIQNYYQIAINLKNVVMDAYYHNGRAELKWDSAVKSAVVLGKNSWAMEVAIPLQNMHADAYKDKAWRFNICRNKRSGVQENYENQQWTPTLKNYHSPKDFGLIIIASEKDFIETASTFKLSQYRYSYTLNGKLCKAETAKLKGYVKNNIINWDFTFAKDTLSKSLITIIPLKIPKNLPINSHTAFEMKFRNQSPGVSITVSYCSVDTNGKESCDYYRLAYLDPAPAWQIKSFNFSRDGYLTHKLLEAGKKIPEPKTLTSIYLYIFANGGTFAGEQRKMEIDYFRITDNPLKIILK